MADRKRESGSAFKLAWLHIKKYKLLYIYQLKKGNQNREFHG